MKVALLLSLYPLYSRISASYSTLKKKDLACSGATLPETLKVTYSPAPVQYSSSISRRLPSAVKGRKKEMRRKSLIKKKILLTQCFFMLCLDIMAVILH